MSPKPATLCFWQQCCRIVDGFGDNVAGVDGALGNNVAGFGDNVAVFGDNVAGFGDNVAVFGDNVAVFGDIVAGVDGT